MTKKSAARIKRDEMAAEVKKQDVSPYVGLEEMFQTQLALFRKYHEMATMIIVPELVPFHKDINHTNNLLRALAADSRDLYARTKALHDRHAGRTVPNPNDEDEHIEVIMMFQEYQAFQGVHMQTILPVMLELDEVLNYAVNAYKAAQATAVAEQPAAGEAVQIVEAGGQSYQADAQGNPVPHTAPATMADVEAAAAPI